MLRRPPRSTLFPYTTLCRSPGELYYVDQREGSEPLGVVAHLGFVTVQDQVGLIEVRQGVRLDLLRREDWTGLRSPRWVAHPRGVIPYDEHRRVTEALELVKLLEDHDEAEVDVRCGRVYPELDPEVLAAPQTAIQLPPRDDVHGIAVDSFEARSVTH